MIRSPQVYARIGGVLYLIIIVAGLFGEAFASWFCWWLCSCWGARII
jgi:hypothetical protein